MHENSNCDDDSDSDAPIFDAPDIPAPPLTPPSGGPLPPCRSVEYVKQVSDDQRMARQTHRDMDMKATAIDLQISEDFKAAELLHRELNPGQLAPDKGKKVLKVVKVGQASRGKKARLKQQGYVFSGTGGHRIATLYGKEESEETPLKVWGKDELIDRRSSKQPERQAWLRRRLLLLPAHPTHSLNVLVNLSQQPFQHQWSTRTLMEIRSPRSRVLPFGRPPLHRPP